jgi:hypothetical protein
VASKWLDFKEPGHVPSHSFPLFGADPCHTPARESADPATCPCCGGATPGPHGRPIPHRDRPSDPVRVVPIHVDVNNGTVHAEPLTLVCGACIRSAHDGTAALDRAFRLPVDPDGGPTTPESLDDRPTIEYPEGAEYRDHGWRLKRRVRKPKDVGEMT